MIGAMSAFSMAARVELAERFAPLAAGPEHPWFEPEGRAPGMPSRWSSGRSSACAGKGAFILCLRFLS